MIARRGSIPARRSLLVSVVIGIALLTASVASAQPSFIEFESGHVRPIALSPDGTKLAGQVGFTSGGTGIVVFSFTSGTYERLTALGVGEWPVWFGDSRRLLYVDKMREFWVIDTETKVSRRIYSTTRDVLGPPRLTRDGRVAFYSRRVTQADIYLLTFQ